LNRGYLTTNGVTCVTPSGDEISDNMSKGDKTGLEADGFNFVADRCVVARRAECRGGRLRRRPFSPAQGDACRCDGLRQSEREYEPRAASDGDFHLRSRAASAWHEAGAATQR